MPILLRAAASAAEMNQRHSLVGMSKDGLSFEGLDAMAKKTDADGNLDAGATATAHLAAARDFFLEAVTPDKALMLGAVGAVGGDDPDKISIAGAAISGAFGAVGDALEALPAAALAIAYAVSAAAYGAVELVDGD